MIQNVHPPARSSATINDLLSIEQRREIEARENEELTPESRRTVLTGLYLKLAHRIQSAPLCVLEFKRLR